jgi:hypothetical protein
MLWQKGHIPWNKGLPKEMQPSFGKQNALGFNHSDDAKNRISVAHKGKIVSQDTRDKISLAAIEHGHSRIINGKKGSREYHSWSGMKARCLNPKGRAYLDYGGRGIMVCEDWKNSFENFLQDMGKCPPDFSLDRIDMNGNYEPSNCRWADNSIQMKNRRHITSAQYIKLEKVFLFTLICLGLAMRKEGEKWAR